MAKKVMILLESFYVRREALQYSIELAKRMDSTLVFFLIIPLEICENADKTDPLEIDVKDAMISHMDAAQRAGVSVEAVIRMGDPSSELMKFLAISRSIQTIVWGGEKDLINQRSVQKRAHWLVKLKDVVEIPVVIPSMKVKSKSGRSSAQDAN